MENSEFHPVVLAADTANMQASGFESALQGVTQGIPSAAASGLLSIWNTVQGATGGDQVDTSRFLHDVDNSMGDYYDTHKEGVDMVGFIGTSFIPGMAGVKLLKAARSGEAMTGAGRALGLTATRKEYWLAEAIKETAQSGGTIKSIISGARGKQLAWETADQALQGAAFELAVAATMNNSPVFDNSTLSDATFNVVLGTVLSGAIGGPLASIGARGILKSVQAETDALKRAVDTVYNPVKEGLLPGTSTLLFAESIATLPDAALSLSFKYKYDNVAKSVVIDVADVMRDTKLRAVKTAEGQLGLSFNELATGNEAIGQAYFDLIRNGLSAAKAMGKDGTEQIAVVQGWLNNVSKLSHVDLEKMAINEKKFYVTLEPESLLNLFSKTKEAGVTGKSAYMLAEGIDEASLRAVNFVDTGAVSLRALWRSGEAADIVILPSGKAAINPASKNVQRVFENPSKVEMFVDPRTGVISPEAVIHFADTVQPGRFFNGAKSIGVGTRVYEQAATVLPDFAQSAIVGSARFAWASKFGAAGSGHTINDLFKLTGGSIDSLDLPLFSRILELHKEFGAEAVAKFMVKHDGDLIPANELLNVDHLLTQKKYEVLQAELSFGEAYDVKHLAAHLNASPDFIEDAIARGFIPPSFTETLAGDLATIDALAPKTVTTTWDFKAAIMESGLSKEELYKQQMGPAFQATKELSAQYQLAVRDLINKNAFSTTLSEFAHLFPDAPAALSKEATQGGAGAGLVTASNAGYGERAKLWVQEVGKQVMNVTQRIREREMNSMLPTVNAIKANPAAAAELGVLTNAMRKSEFRYVFDPLDSRRLLSTEVTKLMAKDENLTADAAIQLLLDTQKSTVRSLHSLEIANKEVSDFLSIHTRLNTARQEKMTVLHNAAGLTKGPHNPDVVYIPPVNTVKYPFHAFVKTKDQIGLASDITMLTAKDEESLRKLVAGVDTGKYDVHYKKDTELYYKAKGQYDYQSTIHESKINSDMARTGKLADFFPETNATNVLTDYLEFHSKQAARFVRTGVQVKERQFFGEVQFLSDNYRVVSESTATGVGAQLKKKIEDPFADYIKTALDVSKQQEFPLLDSLNEFVDKVGIRLGKEYNRAQEHHISKKMIKDPETGLEVAPWEYADKMSQKFGMGMPYATGTSNPLISSYIEANTLFPKNKIKEAFQLVNMTLANFTLRLDGANSLINMISTPIMMGTELQSIKSAIAGDSALVGKLAELTSVRVPGQAYSVPSNTKLIANAIGNFFGAEKTTLLRRYKDIGAVKTVLSTYHDMLDSVAFDSVLNPKSLLNRMNDGVEKMAKYTGNNFSEEFTRFITADAMRQLTEPLISAGKMSVKEQNAYINVFVNRVQGNYVTSQRPVIFQGTTGAAVSLFQTYAFNVLQQLYRHVEAKDTKALMVFAGLQSSIFGMNGLPFFDAVNTHLIGGMVAGNNYHGDAYSALPAANKELGDWMLYGTASAFPAFSGTSPALYSRGDINPRHITVIPIYPSDVPAVQASIKLAGTVYDFGKNVANGVDLSAAMLAGLEHQGVNRPLAGFAQLLAGRSTTSQGAVISASNDMMATSRLGALAERVISIEGVSRLMGARPMDEAVALNNIYRNKGYDALDKQRLETLGKQVKIQLGSGNAPDEEQLFDLMSKYAAVGGRQENFSAAMQRWQRDSSVSIINQTAARLSTNSNRRMQEILGGYTAPDLTTQPQSDQGAQQ